MRLKSSDNIGAQMNTLGIEVPFPNRRWFRFVPWVLGALIGIALLTLGLLFPFLLVQIANNPRGPIDDRGQWPQPLLELLANAATEDIQVEPVKVFMIQDFLEKYYFCRMAASPELVALISSKWDLKPGSQVDVDRFKSKWPTDWEAGDFSDQERCLANRGHKSDNYIVLVDEAKQNAYVFYYFNF